jgi:hypothetical protein
VRYYVLNSGIIPGESRHIIAEVVCDPLDEDRSLSLASALAGDRAQIATRSELIADPASRAALAAWEGQDDTTFDRETEMLANEPEPDPEPTSPARLRLVRSSDRRAV